MPLNFSDVTFWAHEIEEQFRKKNELTEMEGNCHRQIVAGRLRDGYMKCQIKISRRLMEKPVERGGQQTYVEYYDQVKRTVQRPILNLLTVMESQIIYLACGIRNPVLREIVLCGYGRHPINLDLKDIVHHELWSFECDLAIADLPPWSNASRLELAYDPYYEQGNTSDYDSERN